MNSPADYDPKPRRASVAVDVGGVIVGGGAPVVVQSMTNTDTADIDATVRQVAALFQAGSEMVRITVDRDESAAAVPKIRERLLRLGMDVPLIGDFHYIGHKLASDLSGRCDRQWSPRNQGSCEACGQGGKAHRALYRCADA